MKQGWEEVPLPETVFLQEGPGIRSYEYQDGGYPMINVRCVQDGYIDLSTCNSANVELATGKWKHFQVAEGDILFTTSGSIGRAAVVRAEHLPLLMNTSVVRFRSITPRLRDDFFFYYLQSEDFLGRLHAKASGTAQKNVGPTHVKTLDVPLPPLAEQQRIVGVLDEAFAGLATAQAHAAQNLQNARALFESHLQSVFTHRGKGWVEDAFQSLTTKIGSGATPLGGEAAYKAKGISLIRSLNVYDMGFRYEGLAFLDDRQADGLSNVVVQPRDVLLNITGASVARCCVVPEDVLPARVNQHVSIIRPIPDKLSPEFLHYLLISAPYKKLLLQTGEEGGSTRQAITKAHIQQFRVAFPKTVEAQNAIVKSLDALAPETQRLTRLYGRKQAALAALKESLLHQAFTGQL